MKKTIRITETDLHRIVKESVKKLMKENEDSDLDELNSQFKHVDIYSNPLSNRYQVRIVSFPSVPPISGTKKECIKYAFELESKAERKLNQLIQKAREEGYSEEEIQKAVRERLKH